jgi:orotate phosphoribosyltransferase
LRVALATRAYRYDPVNLIPLSSGQLSKEYFDCKAALSWPDANTAAAEVIFGMLDPRVEAVGGLTMGADPLAISVSNHSAHTDHPLRWFSVRKQPKAHGLKKMIEGAVPEATRVAIVDDVVTEGNSTRDAIDRAREAGYEVVQVIVLVDREQQGGMQRVKDAAGLGVSVQAVFKKSELHAEWERHQPSPPAAS